MAEEVQRDALGNRMDKMDTGKMATGEWYSKFENRLKEQLEKRLNPIQTDNR